MNDTPDKSGEADEQAEPIDATALSSLARSTVVGHLLNGMPEDLARVGLELDSGNPEAARGLSHRLFTTVETNREALIAVSKVKPRGQLEAVAVERAGAAAVNQGDVPVVRDADFLNDAAVRRTQLDLGSGDTYALITQREKVGGNSYFGAHTLKFANELKAEKGVEEADRYVNFATRHERFFAARNPGEAARDMGGGVGAFFGDAVKLGYALGSDTPTRDQAVESLLSLGGKFGKTPEEKTNAVRAVSDGLQAAMQYGLVDEKTKKRIPGTGFDGVASMDGGRIAKHIGALVRNGVVSPETLKEAATKSAVAFTKRMTDPDARYSTPDQIDVLAEIAVWENIPDSIAAGKLSDRAVAFKAVDFAVNQVFGDLASDEGAVSGATDKHMVRAAAGVLQQAVLDGEVLDSGVLKGQSMRDVLRGVALGDPDALALFDGTEWQERLDVARQRGMQRAGMELMASYGLSQDNAMALAAVRASGNSGDFGESQKAVASADSYLQSLDKSVNDPEAPKTTAGVASQLLEDPAYFAGLDEEQAKARREELMAIAGRVDEKTDERIRVEQLLPDMKDKLRKDPELARLVDEYRTANAVTSSATMRQRSRALQRIDRYVGQRYRPGGVNASGTTEEAIGIRLFGAHSPMSDVAWEPLLPGDVKDVDTLVSRIEASALKLADQKGDKRVYVAPETAAKDVERLRDLIGGVKQSKGGDLAKYKVSAAAFGLDSGAATEAMTRIAKVKEGRSLETLRGQTLAVIDAKAAKLADSAATDPRTLASLLTLRRKAERERDADVLAGMLDSWSMAEFQRDTGLGIMKAKTEIKEGVRKNPKDGDAVAPAAPEDDDPAKATK